MKNRNGIERKVMGFLFVLVLVIFSFAESASKKYEQIYTTAQMVKKNSIVLIEIAASALTFPSSKN